MKIRTILLTFSLLVGGQAVQAQLHLGFSAYLNYSLYQWYQQPTTISSSHRSVGQAFNVLPTGGLGFWVGRPNAFFLNIEGGIDYAPFSLDLEEYSGLGAMALPVVARGIIPFDGDKGLSSFVGVGFGVQWSKNGLYRYPNNIKPAYNPFYATVVAEVNLGFGAGWDTDDKGTALMALYFRVGIAAHAALTFNSGLRAKLLYNPMAEPKKLPVNPPKTYQVLLYDDSLF
ncbi:MAG: hypothetical protein GY810_17720 [Aureispira sp.]|nr:hypothetical protein [Aureispira sp.]